MIQQQDIQQLPGKTLLGAGGEKLGTIDVLYADEQDGTPTFATVHTGLFGSRTSFVPLSNASIAGSDVQVPYDKELVKSAPHVERDEHLSPEEEDQLYRHYGIGATTGTTTDTTTDKPRTDTSDRETVGYDTSGPTTDDAMTRSEERLRVGTEKVETGKARLRKYVVTEMQTQTVPVSREEVRIEREPITDANRDAATSGPDISDEEHEVILHEERPVIAKETVPVERVRLATETVTEQKEVTEEVRKERIDTEGLEGRDSAGGEVYPDTARTSTDEQSRR